MSGKWSLTASTVFCLIGFEAGYALKAHIDKRGEQHMPVQKYWDRAARSRWPGLAGWSDVQVMKMLSTPAGFRSAFNDCSAKDDVEIQNIAATEPEGLFDEVSLCPDVLDRPAGRPPGLR